MSTLFELTQDYRQVLDMADDPEIDPQAIIDTLDSIKGEIEDKADGYARVIAELQAESEAIKKQVERLTARAKTIDNNVKAMKERLKDAMIATGKTKFKTELFSFSVRNNGGKTPLVFNVDPGDLPEEFRKTKVSYLPDDEAIRGFLDDGNTSEFFAYGVRGQNLSIR